MNSELNPFSRFYILFLAGSLKERNIRQNNDGSPKIGQSVNSAGTGGIRRSYSTTRNSLFEADVKTGLLRKAAEPRNLLGLTNKFHSWFYPNSQVIISDWRSSRLNGGWVLRFGNRLLLLAVIILPEGVSKGVIPQEWVPVERCPARRLQAHLVRHRVHSMGVPCNREKMNMLIASEIALWYYRCQGRRYWLLISYRAYNVAEGNWNAIGSSLVVRVQGEEQLMSVIIRDMIKDG